MSEPCRLRIETRGLQVDLAGDADFVRSAYSALRAEILTRLAPVPGASDGVVERDPPGGAPAAAERVPDYIWVYCSSDLYHQVYALDRRQLGAGLLGLVVRVARLGRVYLESRDRGELEALVPSGQTLWTELTPLGQTRLRAR